MRSGQALQRPPPISARFWARPYFLSTIGMILYLHLETLQALYPSLTQLHILFETLASAISSAEV